MKTSVTWINDYLEPEASAETQGDALTACGFPFEGEAQLEDGEIQQEIEMSSNRGDCVCHAGLAREIAALTGRRFEPPRPTVEATGDPIEERIRVDNQEPELCSLYTAHLITGVTVGPSPQWMQDRLRTIGQVPRNNLVDATNFVLFELGQPTHVFDLDLVEGDSIIIRRAHQDEAFLPLGEDAQEVKLAESDLVIADAGRPIALAGIKGGAATSVSESTTSILIESATFDRVSVRNSSRRLGIASDSSYRFERGVHPEQARTAAQRLIALILELAGGTLHRGVSVGGKSIPEPNQVSMRVSHCVRLLGQEITSEKMLECLDALELSPVLNGDEIQTTIPPHRLDLAEEIDLIEEVARINGYENLAVNDSMNIVVVPEQSDLKATQLVRNTMVGAGFIETISHTLVSEQAAEAFLETGRNALRVNDERAGGEPILRPSVLPSLLEVARRNRDRAGQVIRAFEIAAVFDEAGDEHRERQMLGLVVDGIADADPSDQYRTLRGCMEELAHLLLGDRHGVQLDPDTANTAGWLDPGAGIMLEQRCLGTIGLLTSSVADQFDARGPIAVAEFELRPLIERFPPARQPQPLPSFPSIERDLSVLIDESVSWAAISQTARAAGDHLLESVDFITTWRGKRLGPDRKSVTLRLHFRDETRTLRHEEVDPQVQRISQALTETLGGEIRS